MISWRQKSTVPARARHNYIPMLFFPLQPSLLFKLLTNPLLVNLPQTQIIPSNQPLMRSLLMNESSTLLSMVSQNVPMVYTNWPNRASNDLDSVSCAILKVDSSIIPQSFRDCYCLGKYTRNSNRLCPILVTLNRSADVTNVLSKRSSLKGDSIVIKPDLSPIDKANEKMFLNQRWSLIQSGTNRISIKIRGSRLYVNDRIHGQVINSEYQIHPPLTDHHTSLLSPTNTSDTPAGDSIRTSILGTNSEFDSAAIP